MSFHLFVCLLTVFTWGGGGGGGGYLLNRGSAPRLFFGWGFDSNVPVNCVGLSVNMPFSLSIWVI